ncbi:MAG: hypothetical protein QOJ19_3828 [Acidimicrobiia bacterium]|jgi:uncharacterized OB-fold protein|nr:hypothetical protein [Acidimicrobiia bacterium]
MITDDELLDSWPGVRVDHDNAEHYRGMLQQRLLINRCAECGAWHHPPRSVCPRCWSNAVRAEEVSGRGTVAMLTFIHQGSSRAGVDFSNGYPAAAVELIEQAGLRVAGTLVDMTREEMHIGTEVELTWLEVGGRPALGFRPSGASSRP